MENMLARIKELEATVKALTEALLAAQDELRKQRNIVAYYVHKESEADDE